jgi:DNA-binding IscR family transcriptional regulator
LIWGLTIFLSNIIILVVNVSDVYRVEALLELAGSFPGSLTAREVARRRDIPPTFLARLLGELARDDLVLTSRGPRGGVRLGAAPEDIGLARVLRADPLPDAGGEAVHWLAHRLADAHAEALAPLNLAGLLTVEKDRETPPSYEI